LVGGGWSAVAFRRFLCQSGHRGRCPSRIVRGLRQAGCADKYNVKIKWRGTGRGAHRYKYFDAFDVAGRDKPARPPALQVRPSRVLQLPLILTFLLFLL